MQNPLVEIKESSIPVNAFRIMNINVFYNTSANINVDIYHGNSLIVSKMLILDGEDYQAWSNDSPFLNNWIANKLNFVLV